jgi:hypothetical protein
MNRGPALPESGVRSVSSRRPPGLRPAGGSRQPGSALQERADHLLDSGVQGICREHPRHQLTSALGSSCLSPQPFVVRRVPATRQNPLPKETDPGKACQRPRCALSSRDFFRPGNAHDLQTASPDPALPNHHRCSPCTRSPLTRITMEGPIHEQCHTGGSGCVARSNSRRRGSQPSGGAGSWGSSSWKIATRLRFSPHAHEQGNARTETVNP